MAQNTEKLKAAKAAVKEATTELKAAQKNHAATAKAVEKAEAKLAKANGALAKLSPATKSEE